MKTLLITGETYKIRREIRALGGRWNGEHKGWIVPFEKRQEAEALTGRIIIAPHEAPDDIFKPLTTEDIRAIRQDRANRKADRLEKWAESRQKKADELDKQTRPFTSDWSFVTQPITPNAGGRRFAKFRQKITDKVDKKYALMNEADDLLERAESLREPVLVKGDTAKKRQAKLEFIRSQIKVGDTVTDWIYGEGVISKINQKTYKTEGSTLLKNIEFIKL